MCIVRVKSIRVAFIGYVYCKSIRVAFIGYVYCKSKEYKNGIHRVCVL
jgi:hypothetical protein